MKGKIEIGSRRCDCGQCRIHMSKARTIVPRHARSSERCSKNFCDTMQNGLTGFRTRLQGLTHSFVKRVLELRSSPPRERKEIISCPAIYFLGFNKPAALCCGVPFPRAESEKGRIKGGRVRGKSCSPAPSPINTGQLSEQGSE